MSGLNIGALSRLDQVARALHVRDSDVSATLDCIVQQAAEVLGVANQAGIILLEHGRLEPHATAGEVSRKLDLLQQESNEGPCLEAARTQQLVVVDDTADDDRWPGLASQALDLGVHSMLCAPLTVDDHTLGALSLYADRPHVFTDDSRLLATIYATLASLALANAQQARQLTEALLNRDIIGQAKGILMERHKISADQAFRLLVAASQRRNIKLSEIAHRMTETGDLTA
jgi:GAF domain-containing protein